MNRLFFVSLLLLAPDCLHSASFDCSKARTSIEKTICSSPELSVADNKLAEAYQAAQKSVPEAGMVVREAQRKWLQSVERNCPPVDSNPPFAKCLAVEWESRTSFLSHIVVRIGGVPFVFREASFKMSGDQEIGETEKAEFNRRTGGSEEADSDGHPSTFYATWHEAISNAPQWQAWNKALLDEARRFNASQDTEDEVPDHWVVFPDPTWHSDVEISVNVDGVSPTFVATTIRRDYTYAHPARQERAFNWLLKQSREIRPDDLFRSNSGWNAWMKKRVAQIVKDYEITALKSEPSEAEEIAASAAGVAVEPRYWRIGNKGLDLIFTQDRLGYLTALTMPDISFSWVELKPYLNLAFEIPQ
jgi:uncharacterized protein YecT (DUF1311 family)